MTEGENKLLAELNTALRKRGGKVGKRKKVGKKKQGYKARKDESIAMRVKKKINKSRIKSTIRRTSGAGQGAKYIAGFYD